jgi:hypothetical protein
MIIIGDGAGISADAGTSGLCEQQTRNVNALSEEGHSPDQPFFVLHASAIMSSVYGAGSAPCDA